MDHIYTHSMKALNITDRLLNNVGQLKLCPRPGNWVLFIQSIAVCVSSLCWCVCLLFLMPTLATTWQGAARARPTTQTWCGIKQLNRTKPANQKETNGNTRTWVFSCHRAVGRRWRGDRAVLPQSVITLRRQRKIKALITLCSLLWARPHRLSGQSWLTLKWQWREFTVYAFLCKAALPNW